MANARQGCWTGCSFSLTGQEEQQREVPLWEVQGMITILTLPSQTHPGVKPAVVFALPGVVPHVLQVNDKVVTVSGLKFQLFLTGLYLFACSVLSSDSSTTPAACGVWSCSQLLPQGLGKV